MKTNSRHLQKFTLYSHCQHDSIAEYSSYFILVYKFSFQCTLDVEEHQGFSSFRNHCFLAGLYSMIVVCEIAPRRGQVNNCNYKQYALSPQSAVLEVGGYNSLGRRHCGVLRSLCAEQTCL